MWWALVVQSNEIGTATGTAPGPMEFTGLIGLWP